ncbi:hypothetical protein AQS8620_02146 [Aquimixticola soesokkakensis]|uniref:DUF2177 domain-containing protein n=1 Tax=Aquimixticola soesokkakensis TaxID=1519096 RepID=A0A1Y5SWE9_9RHOB|nr:DUF2177 family protein [Aquimixticola soesokkakensis]SLN50051.1 hypothetical protein AQS8620_02146 [Aquimixticola soesokkakensis]
MQYIILYFSTALIFLGCDAVMLKHVMRPLFVRSLGDQLAEDFRLGPAAVFYLFYIAGILILASLPALREGSAWPALWKGALIGAMAYGTYEFTSYAVMARWSPHMVYVDVAWGIFVTGLSAWGGVMITRALLGLFN